MSAPVLRSSWLLCQDLFRAVASLHANASHSIGNDFLDLGHSIGNDFLDLGAGNS